MAKRKKRIFQSIGIQDSTPLIQRGIILAVLTILFFLLICFSNSATIKVTTLVLMCLVILFGIFCFPTLRNRIKLPFVILLLFVLVNGISTSYALSGKFALYEFLKLVAALCAALLLTMIFPGEGVNPGRRIAILLEGSVALAGLLSIDLISTRLLSDPFVALFSRYTSDFSNLTALVPGVRMNSIFENPNIFGGCAGIGVMLSLGLALSSQGKKERSAHLCCLYVTATAFILAFSMGAIASIVVAFLVYLLLEHKERRSDLLFLMIKTFILVLASVAVIAVVAFDEWNGIQPIPLLCLVIGAVLLCLADRFVGIKLAKKLQGGVKSLIVIAVVLALVISFGIAAYNWTGPASLESGETLRRAVYPAPGEYTVIAEGFNETQVTITSQNEQDALTGASTTLYQGDLDQAVFTVPEDSIVVYFSFRASQPASLESVQYVSDDHAGTVPLGYKLLPDFIAYRIQGMFASHTAIERVSLFRDGLKLFRSSPVIGLGIGSFETAIYSVQSYVLETKYVHNHYIQTMLETGIIGLILFVGLLGVCAACILISRFKKKDFHPLTPALGAALVFMAIHGFVEVDFSTYQFLPLAFGVFILINLCCGDAIPTPWLGKKVRSGIAIVLAVLMIFFAVLLGNNMSARRIADTQLTFDALDRSIRMDKFEWADYALSYVMSSINNDVPEEIHLKAAEYAEELSKLSSNTIPLYLTEYYLVTNNVTRAMEMAEKYTAYVSANAEAWNNLFHMLAQHEIADEAFYEGVERLAAKLEEWNANNLSTIRLDQESQDFLNRVSSR